MSERKPAMVWTHGTGSTLGWHTGSPCTPSTWIANSPCACRPLVIIDPEDDEEVGRLIALYVERGERLGYEMPEYQHLDRRLSMADALREFARPTPSIEEPQVLGTVVEASYHEEGGRSRGPYTYALAEDGSWLCLTDGRAGQATSWCFLRAVRILSPGVTP